MVTAILYKYHKRIKDIEGNLNGFYINKFQLELARGETRGRVNALAQHLGLHVTELEDTEFGIIYHVEKLEKTKGKG